MMIMEAAIMEAAIMEGPSWSNLKRGTKIERAWYTHVTTQWRQPCYREHFQGSRQKKTFGYGVDPPFFRGLTLEAFFAPQGAQICS
jgi:hypothetical protein